MSEPWVNHLSISPAGRALIESFEGLKLAAYQDCRGIWTIGYGHTGWVKEGDTCTQAQADAWQASDAAFVANVLNSQLEVELSQNQFDALGSLTYNIGVGHFLASTLFALLQKGDFAGAAEQFEKWSFANGKWVDGLHRRRLAEKQMFLGAANAAA
jgi:lysozyme